MNEEKFITFEELEEYEINYDVESNGMSGQHHGYRWFTASNESETIELYVK